MIHFKNFARIFGLTLIGSTLVACGNTDSVTPKDAVSQAEITHKTTTVDVAAIAEMSPMQLMESTTVQSNQLADILGNVMDEDSAQAAVTRIRLVGPQLKAMNNRLDTLNEDDIKFSPKTMKSMKSFAEAQMRIFNETGRIAKDHPELWDVIVAGFEDSDIDFQ